MEFRGAFWRIVEERMRQTGMNFEALSSITGIDVTSLMGLTHGNLCDHSLVEAQVICRALSFTLGDVEKLASEDYCHYEQSGGPKTVLDDVVNHIVKSDGIVNAEWVAKLFTKLDSYYRLRK